jgi:hypothetical protein
MYTYKVKMKIWFGGGLRDKVCSLVVQLSSRINTTSGFLELKNAVEKYFTEAGLYPSFSSIVMIDMESSKPVEGRENAKVVWLDDKKQWLAS